MFLNLKPPLSLTGVMAKQGSPHFRHEIETRIQYPWLSITISNFPFASLMKCNRNFNLFHIFGRSLTLFFFKISCNLNFTNMCWHTKYRHNFSNQIISEHISFMRQRDMTKNNGKMKVPTCTEFMLI